MDSYDVDLIRKSFEAALAGTHADRVVAALGSLGWDDLRQAEPVVAVAELFEAQGRLRAASAALDVVTGEALGLTLTGDQAVVHPGLGRWNSPPGERGADGTVGVDGLVLAGLDRAARLLVPVTGAAGGPGVSVVEVGAAALEATPVAGFDDTLRIVSVRGRVEARSATAPGAGWAAGLAAARRALAHELLGLAGEMLATAARHVTDRIQFGRPIAAFQTVRHRLTEVHVAIAAARPVLDAAWTTGEPLAADAAKALAGRAGLLAARHCLQVTGAIGFTWEYDLHRQIRRAHLLDGLYGRARALQAQIGADLLAGGSVPRIRPLP